MATIFHHFYENKNAFINPCDTTAKIPGFPEVCITTFSECMIEKYAETNETKVIANLCSANGTLPVYEITYAGKKMALSLVRVGAPACAACLEELIALGGKESGAVWLLRRLKPARCRWQNHRPIVSRQR